MFTSDGWALLSDKDMLAHRKMSTAISPVVPVHKGEKVIQGVSAEEIAAVVTDVLANGNLVIQGRQEVRTNREVRELTVAGIVRPEDISSANTINHTQIAEARISYGGRGDISRMQATPAAQSLVERFSPF